MNDEASARPAKTLTEFRQGQFPGDARLRVMVAANDKRCDARLVEPSQLIGEKPGRLHRRLLAVIEVAGDQERIHLFRKAQIDHGDKGFSRRPANEIGEFGVAQRQRRQRQIKVDVGCVNESEGHSLIGAKLRNR